MCAYLRNLTHVNDFFEKNGADRHYGDRKFIFHSAKIGNYFEISKLILLYKKAGKFIMTKSSAIIYELINGPSEDFSNHLQLQNNERIIFSAPYGFGKTTFLKEYFSSEEQLERYEVIHLFPVNYSVATNEDIFKYLKFDIIYELLNKDIELEANDFSYLETLPFFLKKNLDSFLALLLLFVPKIGTKTYSIYEKLKGLADKYLEYYDSLNEGDSDKIDKYFQGFIEKDGSIYEENIFTQFIMNQLDKLKQSKEESKIKKETILILDDLDRIDPHHIFRLFNVFAAHFDSNYYGKSNKFGFDKVIFVCDIKNIRNIFKSNYGADVDFNGYIDKFYSRNIYYFDNRENTLTLIKLIISKLQFQSDSQGSATKLSLLSATITSDYKYILYELIKSKAINLRAFLKHLNSQIFIPYKKVNFYNNTDYYNFQFPVILLIETLIQIFGDFEHLNDAFKLSSSSPDEVAALKEYKNLLGSCLLVVDFAQHTLDKTNTVFTYPFGAYKIEYTFVRPPRGSESGYCSVEDIKFHSTKVEGGPNIMGILSLCMDYLKKIKYFN